MLRKTLGLLTAWTLLHADTYGQTLSPPAAVFKESFWIPGSQMMANLTGVERDLYRKGRDAFNKVSSVQGDTYFPNTEVGLGPTFNSDSCVSCHAHPTAGGSSPDFNPQLLVAKQAGARNRIPSFLTEHGPVLQVRFKRHTNGFPDGLVHPLFTISGRKDAGQCEMSQPDFEREYREGNLGFRIPTPLYGIGLIEAIKEESIEANASELQEIKQSLGITGHANRNMEDGTLARFGWKAQTSSLEIFTAEAYAIEQGVTNELFPQERMHPAQSCLLNATPEDHFLTNFRNSADSTSNVYRAASFVRFLAPPSGPYSSGASSTGSDVFQKIGCAVCHTPSFTTGASSYPALDHREVRLYSDLLVHHMGVRLADGIEQGQAGQDEFRTAPLWGVGQRLFFLHDGRTKDLNEAILLHSSPEHSLFRPSEAENVIRNYKRLSALDRQALLLFLRSL